MDEGRREGGIGIFGFAVLAAFRSVFCQKTSVFGFAAHSGLRIVRGLAFDS